MSSPLTRNEIRQAVFAATQRVEAVNSYALHDRLCRTDAIGRISKSDSEYFDSVLADMVAAGEITQNGPFISDPTKRSGRIL